MDSCNLFGDKWSCVFLDATTSVGRLFLFTKEKTMADYKKMYLQMYNAITDAIEILKEAQIKAEEEFIESEDKPIELSEFLNKKK